jgi:transposase-like protein
MAKEQRHTPEQIIGKLREAKVKIAKGVAVAQVCKDLAVTEQTYYHWRKEYGGLKLDQAKRLKELERENSRLKRLLAEAELDKAILKEAASGKYSTVRERAKTPRFPDSAAPVRPGVTAVSSSSAPSSGLCGGSAPRFGTAALGRSDRAAGRPRGTNRDARRERRGQAPTSVRPEPAESPRGDDRESAARDSWASETTAPGRDYP